MAGLIPPQRRSATSTTLLLVVKKDLIALNGRVIRQEFEYKVCRSDHRVWPQPQRYYAQPSAVRVRKAPGDSHYYYWNPHRVPIKYSYDCLFIHIADIAHINFEYESTSQLVMNDRSLSTLQP